MPWISLKKEIENLERTIQERGNKPLFSSQVLCTADDIQEFNMSLFVDLLFYAFNFQK